MRTAVCFYGLVGSKSHKGGVGEPLDVSLAGKHNFKNIIANNNADIFIHSWSLDSLQEITAFYQPKDSLIEAQAEINFPKKFIYNRPNSEIMKLLLNPLSVQTKIKLWQQEAFRACSRWLSCKKAIKLLTDYEKENSIRYDAVLLTRLDVGFFTPFDFGDYNLDQFWVSNWNNAPKKGTNHVYDTKNLNQNFGFLDFWFMSNSANIKKFSALYDDLFSLSVSPHRSSYEFAKKIGMNIGYSKYRWSDYEMVRRKFLDYSE